jgi:hypothetical protein
MNQTKKMLVAAALLSLPIVASAQTENPRGIYKMTTLIGKLGEVKAPYDQYKICTDSITLMLNVSGSSFSIANTDRMVLNYTGSEPKYENDKRTLIYDSDANHFTLKWWSTDKGHLYFPDNDWCYEKYVANQYTEVGRIACDVLTATNTAVQGNPLLGNWRILGWMDELKGAKKQLAVLRANYENSKYVGQYLTFTPEALVATNMNVRRSASGVASGGVQKCELPDKNTLKLPRETSTIKWLSKDVIALEVRNDFRIDWQILERVTDGQSLLSRIASQSLKK